MHEPVKAPRRRIPSPWVWGSVAVLAVLMLVAGALRFVTASCAAEVTPADAGAAAPAASARGGAAAPAGSGTAGLAVSAPPAGALRHGQAYFYSPGDGEGSCSFGPLHAGGLYVSVGSPQYAGGAACGSYLDVAGPRGTVRAEVVDLCPGCTAGGLDLSEAAFARVADPAAGTAEVSYRAVRDPRPARPLELRMAQSASAGSLAVQVLNNGNPLASVAVAPDGPPAKARWRPLVLNSGDYWSAPAGAGPGPFMFRVSDVFGHRAVLAGIRLRPGSVQRTSVLMYPAGGPAQVTPTVRPKGVPQHSAAPITPGARPAGPGTAARPHPSPSGTTGAHC